MIVLSVFGMELIILSRFYLLGTFLVIVGIALSLAKWFLGYEGIGIWPLATIVPGLILNWLGRRNDEQIRG